MNDVTNRIAIALLIFATAGCRYGEMYDQPRYEAYDASSFFDDGLSSRPLVDGVVPRTESSPDTDASFQTGKSSEGAFVDALPFPLTHDVLERGRNRFRIFCALCHGLDGAGHGTIVERGFSPPPALYDAKVVDQPLGYYYDVITHGHGAMYGYAARIPTRDRWSVAAYLRALQLSQHATPSMLPEQDLERLKTIEPAKQESSQTEQHSR